MRVSYTPEQRAKAIAAYNEIRSYAKTLRILGYLSRYVQFDRVKNPGSKPKQKQPGRSAKHYSWEPKILDASKKVGSSERASDHF